MLTIVRPDRFVRWQRETFRLFWLWKSRRRGRPPIPTELQQLIADMAAANRTLDIATRGPALERHRTSHS